tara:strand:- start:1013 stop:1189 length:177 start_codon:yes stop_codon:yes gene_type:complete
MNKKLLKESYKYILKTTSNWIYGNYLIITAGAYIKKENINSENKKTTHIDDLILKLKG